MYEPSLAQFTAFAPAFWSKVSGDVLLDRKLLAVRGLWFWWGFGIRRKRLLVNMFSTIIFGVEQDWKPDHPMPELASQVDQFSLKRPSRKTPLINFPRVV
jgi:hypothetical protein